MSQTQFVLVNPTQMQPPPPAGEAPPPYSTMPRSPEEAGPSTSWQSPGPVAGAGYNPRGVRLGYVDFMPRVVQKRYFKDDKYENFDAIIQRANNWLEDHHGLQIISCETVTWTGTKKKEVYSDTALFDRSMKASRHTANLRGFRIWYFADVFPNPQQHAQPTLAIQYKTFVPRPKERFDQLLNRVNEAIGEDSGLAGSIISVETIKQKLPHTGNYKMKEVNTDICFWREIPDTQKCFVFCVRVFAHVGNISTVERIGYQDFLPEYNRRNKENEGYETWSDIMQKANTWVARQQGVRFTNIQSLNVKIKEKGPFEERCMFHEHLCASHRVDVFRGPNRKTKYLRIARVFFVMNATGPRQEFPPFLLTYRTFMPIQLRPATSTQAAEYETTRQLLDRINQWLQITGAHVFAIETVPTRWASGNLGALGPEATFSQNSVHGHRPLDYWFYHVRVYLNGEYMEPPGAVSLVNPAIPVQAV